jgi:hypothetical protein
MEQDHHRVFCHITQNWRAAMPLASLYVVIALIANTTTKNGLSICCDLDPNLYPKGMKSSDAEMATLDITRDKFHPEAASPGGVSAREIGRRLRGRLRGGALDGPGQSETERRPG